MEAAEAGAMSTIQLVRFQLPEPWARTQAHPTNAHPAWVRPEVSGIDGAQQTHASDFRIAQDGGRASILEARLELNQGPLAGEGDSLGKGRDSGPR